MKSRKLITLWRIILGGLSNFLRNAWLSAAAIAVMVITLSIVLFSVIANATFANTIKQITDRIDISVYLKDDITIEQKDKLISDLDNLSEVESVNYVSKDEAFRRYEEQNKNNVELMMTISQIDNPLPASLQVKPTNANNIEPIRQFLETEDIKSLQSDPTSYSGDRKVAIDKITQATVFFRSAGLVGMIVFAVISMLIIFNTIRMTIFNRREELQIMRLLGAGTWFIRGPFIVETVFYGLIAGAISMGLCSVLFNVSSSAFDASSLGLLDISFANTYFRSHFWLILLIQLSLGVLIGGISSFVATRRYLKFNYNK